MRYRLFTKPGAVIQLPTRAEITSSWSTFQVLWGGFLRRRPPHDFGRGLTISGDFSQASRFLATSRTNPKETGKPQSQVNRFEERTFGRGKITCNFDRGSPLGPLGFKLAQHSPTTRPFVERTAEKAFLLSDRI